MRYFVYIITNKPQGVLYIGVTNDLMRRIAEHRQEITQGFAYRYNLKKLVYVESCENIEYALRREKQLKKWCRQWKIELIESINPQWKNLDDAVCEETGGAEECIKSCLTGAFINTILGANS